MGDSGVGAVPVRTPGRRPADACSRHGGRWSSSWGSIPSRPLVVSGDGDPQPGRVARRGRRSHARQRGVSVQGAGRLRRRRSRQLLRPRDPGRDLPGTVADDAGAVVTGASGCGKSSLVRAGLAPALSRPDRPAVVFVPGADPLTALTEAMASCGEQATLIVDQFEELFAVGVPAEVVHGFCAALAEHARRGSAVIVAIRADHLTALAATPPSAASTERGLHFVTPLAGDNLRAAIEEPARRAGLRVEHGLVDLLVRDAEGEPGALPLMSHALVETWRRRDGNVLTVEGYRASGGIRGAVARSADRLYDSLPAEQRPLLRSLMLRLVAPSLEGDPVRCRVATSTLRGDPARDRIVGLLVRARLVTTEEDTVELAHESLARAWPRLRSWLDDDTAGQRILRHLAAAADGWESLGRPESELYRGARLETAIEYRHNAHPDLTTVETQFIDASQRQADSERDALARSRPSRRSSQPPAASAARRRQRAPRRVTRRRAARRAQCGSRHATSVTWPVPPRTTPNWSRWSTGRWPCGPPTGTWRRCSRWRRRGAGLATLGRRRPCWARSPQPAGSSATSTCRTPIGSTVLSSREPRRQ